MAKISLMSFNAHLANNGYIGTLEEGIGGQFMAANVNIRKNTAFHKGGNVIAYCKTFKEFGRWILRDKDVIPVCTQLKITPPKRDTWDG